MTAVKPAGDRVAVTFNDGGRDIVDHVLLGTGYRIDLARYPFLNGDLLRRCIASTDTRPCAAGASRPCRGCTS